MDWDAQKLFSLWLFHCLLFCATFAESFNWIWPFPEKRYTRNALIDAGTLGIRGDSRVIAFGDFNGDQYQDVLVLANDQTSATVYYWDHAAYTFREGNKLQTPERVVNAVPGDFDNDGMLDVLFMTQSPSSDQTNLEVYLSQSDGSFTKDEATIPPSTGAQPLLLDATGDLKSDLLGPISRSPGTQSRLALWKNTRDSQNTQSPLFSIDSVNFDGSPCEIPNPHSNAVVDLDGDCMADIFLACAQQSDQTDFQMWINDGNGTFRLGVSGGLPSGAGAITFADVDRDGTIDMIFPSCKSVSSSTGLGSDCVINIAYNQQLPLCSTPTASGLQNGKRVCRSPGDLCQADASFSFDLTSNGSNKAFVQIPISELFPAENKVSLLMFDTTFHPSLPLPLRVGDANQDGFPDLLPIVSTSPSSSASETSPKLLLSGPCGDHSVHGCHKGRGWSSVSAASSLNLITDARGVAFFDIDEDGTLDILVQRTGAQGREQLSFIQNNLFFDAFFLKAMVLNGACQNGYCHPPNQSQSYRPFGASYSGASYKYTILDTAGKRSAAEVSQMPQTSYHALNTPYAFFGLGRTNNYIENLFVGSTKRNNSFVNIEGVIPNSRLVIFPGEWKRELYLRPGDWIPWVTLTVVIATFLLAVIVFALHTHEKREDERERRKGSHMINFDAL